MHTLGYENRSFQSACSALGTQSNKYAVKLRVLARWKLTSVAGSASVPDDSAAESSDMADKVEMVRPTEFGCRSPVLYTLSPSSLSEPGALSEDSMGVLTSAVEDETCSITISHVLRMYVHIFALPTVINKFRSANAQTPPSSPLPQFLRQPIPDAWKVRTSLQRIKGPRGSALELTCAPPGEAYRGPALMMLCEEFKWLLSVQRCGCSVLKILVAMLTMRSPCAISAPLYQDRKNWP
jgi:hypothetical protein